ncbi:MAG: HD-GYP domain-containing protein [Chloroflexota bacterium]|nr:HD-GYP domain-containing protein [Chloroflexota bacterium]
MAEQPGNATKPEAGAQSTYALIAAIEAKDPFIRGHSAEVARVAVAIAQELGLPEKAIDSLRAAAILHDVGKISVPGEILNKPGRLSWAEWQLVKTHVAQGLRILSEANFPTAVKAAVAQHHERLDGSGYPQALRGDQIHLEARILAVADVFEAMTSHRPYRPAASVQETVQYIKDNSGTKFDPAVVDAFLQVLGKEQGDITPSSTLSSYSYSHPVGPAEMQMRRGGVRRVLRRRVLVRRRA